MTTFEEKITSLFRPGDLLLAKFVGPSYVLKEHLRGTRFFDFARQYGYDENDTLPGISSGDIVFVLDITTGPRHAWSDLPVIAVLNANSNGIGVFHASEHTFERVDGAQ